LPSPRPLGRSDVISNYDGRVQPVDFARGGNVARLPTPLWGRPRRQGARGSGANDGGRPLE
jgi:hypothetical protein